MEVCVDNITSCKNAVKGGASRLELCSSLSEGGLTPSLGSFSYIQNEITSIPIFPLLRPRGGDFFYSEDEIDIMKRDIRILASHGAQGFVFGCLTVEAEVDELSCEELLRTIREIIDRPSVTFHRAIDVSKDLVQAAEVIQRLGFNRILTSGGCSNAYEGRHIIKTLHDRYHSNLSIMAGGGLTPTNLESVIYDTGITEFHASARERIPSHMRYRNDECRMGKNSEEYSMMITSVQKVQEMIRIYDETITLKKKKGVCGGAGVKINK